MQQFPFCTNKVSSSANASLAACNSTSNSSGFIHADDIQVRVCFVLPDEMYQATPVIFCESLQLSTTVTVV